MPHTIFTIGYSGITPSELEQIVDEHNALLVDIRFSPRSKALQWRGDTLRKQFGDRYMHLRSLGNIHYRDGLPIELENPENGVAILGPILEKQPVILLCVCRDHEVCHRSHAARYLAQRLGAAIEHL
jgi:uncharacterized protein (DUF488 family)